MKIVLVGRLSRHKGSDVAVDAVGLLRQAGTDVRLQLVGDVYPGNEGFRSGLISRCERWGITEQVDLAGFRPSPWSAYDEADIVVVPSRSESFGNVAVEAMLAGRPVIVSDAQGLPEIVTDGETGLMFPLGDPKALAACVVAALKDWGTTVEIAGRGRARARDTFGVDTFAEAIDGLLDRMAPAA